MTQKKNNDSSNKNVEPKVKKKKKRSILKGIVLSILLIVLIGTGVIGGLVYGAIRDVPVIDASNIDDLLNQNSFILDKEGNIIEKVLAEENRTAESIENMPDYLGQAFISIEDERFYEHFGVDIRGIMAAIVEDIKAGSSVRGASTITQQLARNVYLTNEKKLKRKVKEAYIAIKLEKQLTKDQILESYLNKIYLGQGAYGVKEAAFTYFSKEDLKDLTIAESALIAGITKHPARLSPYITVKPQDVPEGAIVVGSVELLGEKYTAIFNEQAVERQRTILKKMNELGHITEAEYNEALAEDMTKAINPGKKIFSDISSYFVDYVKQQVVEDLVAKNNITKEEAHSEILTGGLRIYSTVDLALQKDIEDMYTNFSSLVFRGKKGSTWSTDRNGNIVDSTRKVVYLKKSNLLTEEGDLFIEKDNYELTDGGLVIKSSKFNVYPSNVDIQDYYTLENGHLISHNIGSLDMSKEDYNVNEAKDITIKKEYLSTAKDFYKIDERNNLVISSNFFLDDETGIVQPQSSTVVIDQHTGQLKAIVGGRNLKGSKILNRALTPRQPGSSIKPIAAYLPALDTGYNAGSGIDDVPSQMISGKPWPKNSYSGYKGLMPMREAIRISSNAGSVNMIEAIGVNTSKEYLKKLGIIKENQKDDFVTRLEDKSRNDENASALGLGGMTRGISPLDMAGAYAAMANDGTFIKPASYTKVEDRYGNLILDNTPKKTTVVSPGVAYVMTDMLRDVVTNGTGKRARVSGVEIAGKTGTTSDNTDAWFVGYSPNYTTSIWIGNDSPAVKLPNGSALAADFFSKVMTRVHQNVEVDKFKEPEDMIRRSVCTISGKIPTSYCTRDPRGVVKTEIFASGHEPTDSCNVHVKGRISIDPPYSPSKFGGVVPDDYGYRVGSYSSGKSKSTPKKKVTPKREYNKKPPVEKKNPVPQPQPEPVPQPQPEPVQEPQENQNNGGDNQKPAQPPAQNVDKEKVDSIVNEILNPQQ